MRKYDELDTCLSLIDRNEKLSVRVTHGSFFAEINLSEQEVRDTVEIMLDWLENLQSPKCLLLIEQKGKENDSDM